VKAFVIFDFDMSITFYYYVDVFSNSSYSCSDSVLQQSSFA
jgi:hypothetical protein